METESFYQNNLFIVCYYFIIVFIIMKTKEFYFRINWVKLIPVLMFCLLQALSMSETSKINTRKIKVDQYTSILFKIKKLKMDYKNKRRLNIYLVKIITSELIIRG